MSSIRLFFLLEVFFYLFVISPSTADKLDSCPLNAAVKGAAISLVHLSLLSLYSMLVLLCKCFMFKVCGLRHAQFLLSSLDPGINLTWIFLYKKYICIIGFDGIIVI